MLGMFSVLTERAETRLVTQQGIDLKYGQVRLVSSYQGGFTFSNAYNSN